MWLSTANMEAEHKKTIDAWQARYIDQVTNFFFAGQALSREAAVFGTVYGKLAQGLLESGKLSVFALRDITEQIPPDEYHYHLFWIARDNMPRSKRPPHYTEEDCWERNNMARIQLEAVGLEFEENGNTIWVQGANGTLLRIKCTGRIQVKPCSAPEGHADVIVPGDIDFCIHTRAPEAAEAPTTVERRQRRAATEAPTTVARRARQAGRVSTSGVAVQAVGRRAGAVPAAQTLVRGTGRRSR